ncbi:MAG: alpha-ketoglutarate-dependent dioxygenase AlkB [Myxococcota bacterium]
MPYAKAAPRQNNGHFYFKDYLDARARSEVLQFLTRIHPLWEYRYSSERPPPEGRAQRRLLRPVYWLGNWQFACLDYYRPPRGLIDRCVKAEPFPPVLARIVSDVEARIKKLFPSAQVPRGFRLNTCLINLYGDREENGRWLDSARVGEHRDFEPGPVASLSLGERALLQFVMPHRSGERAEPFLSQWLDDGSLQVFGGPLFKDRALHRVQRVDDRLNLNLPPQVEGFSTRRVNFTFRFVPEQHVIPFERLGERARRDVQGYVRELARHSAFFREALARAGDAGAA